MLESRKSKCAAIIHSASMAAAAVGGGLAQIPMSDSIPISSIQIAMIVSIGAVYGVKLSVSGASGMLASKIATEVGRKVSQGLVGWIPGLGNIFNAATAMGITEAIGWEAVQIFEKNGNAAVALVNNQNDIFKYIESNQHDNLECMEFADDDSECVEFADDDSECVGFDFDDSECVGFDSDDIF